MGQKLIGDVFVELLVIFLAVAVIRPKEMLRDEHAPHGVGARRLADLAVEDEERRSGLEAVAQPFELLLVVARFERQIQHRQREHQFREIPRGLREVAGQKRRFPAMQREVRPKVVHRHQVR